MSDENITFDNNVSDTDSSEASFYDEFSLCTDVTKLKPYECLNLLYPRWKVKLTLMISVIK